MMLGYYYILINMNHLLRLCESSYDFGKSEGILTVIFL